MQRVDLWSFKMITTTLMTRGKLAGWWQLLTNPRCQVIILKEAWFVFKGWYISDICQRITYCLNIFFSKNFRYKKGIPSFQNDLNIFQRKGVGLSSEWHKALAYFITMFLYPSKLIPHFLQLVRQIKTP